MSFWPDRDTCDACGQITLFPPDRDDCAPTRATLCEDCWKARQRVRAELARRLRRMPQDRPN